MAKQLGYVCERQESFLCLKIEDDMTSRAHSCHREIKCDVWMLHLVHMGFKPWP